jgi:endonuclease YncB( thermonuclease family)
MKYETNFQDHCTIVRFRDGDTVECYIRCGHCQGAHYTAVRIPEIESWEPKGSDAHKAAEVARTLTDRFAGQSGRINARSLRRDKYGRVISDIILGDHALSLLIVNMGLAWWGVGKPNPGTASLPVTT